ncbi:hypothetical protein C2G38_2202785 [Gigaspora rosea]|uniref:Uncharacterized protein n=1 Tax=Gigaspora rosea TaxID=44941 RepID=A0A397USD1_9GLOM|nr:hypothetical protein C2G38_2202785 [Gigaspora rosea]
MERYKEAIIDLTKLLDIELNGKFALRYQEGAYYLIERFKEAINDLTKLLNIEPSTKFALRYRAEAYYLMEKYTESFNVNQCVDDTYELGYFYLHGINVGKDAYKTFAQFEKSANMGHAKGINCLGYCYLYGIEVENRASILYFRGHSD